MAEEEKEEKETKEEKEVKTFTQEEVNALTAKRTEKAKKDVLKEFGFESPGQVKAALEKLKELEAAKKQDEPKGDTPKKDPVIDSIQKELEKLRAENEETKAKNEKIESDNRRKDLRAMATKFGVSEESVNDVVDLVIGKKDFDEDSMKEFLGKRKYFLKRESVDDFGGKSGAKGGKDAEASVKNRLEKAMGLKKPEK